MDGGSSHHLLTIDYTVYRTIQVDVYVNRKGLKNSNTIPALTS